MIRIAITLPGRGHWTGGEVYLRNMLTVIRDRAADVLHPVLFLTPDEAANHGDGLATLLPQPPVVAAAVASFGRGSGLRSALLTGRDHAAATMFAAHRCTVVFEPAVFYGWRFQIPAVAWMPDFQHRYMPEMFSRVDWLRREAGFRAQIATGRTIMLSSETARHDVERLYPGARGRTAVVRFAQAMDLPNIVTGCAAVKAEYDLPPRFVFLPNQFWKHKNHGVVAAALALAAARGVAEQVPLIVMSGRQDDPRHPTAFMAFMAQAAAAGVTDRIRHLGLIPYRDVLRLAAAADAALNPSLFEGWSTPVEEAKALGTPLILSDLSIHREQAPDALFFAPDDPTALLDHLLAVGRSRPREIAMERIVQLQDARLTDYAIALKRVFAIAVAVRRQPGHA